MHCVALIRAMQPLAPDPPAAALRPAAWRRAAGPRAVPTRAFVLAAALVALLLPRGAGAWDTTFSNYFKANTTAKAQSLAVAKATLNGLTLNCAVYTILQNTSWAPENVTYGDGFAHLVGFSSSRLVPILQAGDPDDPTVTGGPANGPGFSVRTQAGDIDGATVWMLKWVASQANITINFDVVRLPGSVYYGSSKNDTAARAIYLMDTMGYDCVVGTVFITPPRMQFMRYVISHQPYGYQVVTNAPVYTVEKLTDRLFKWSLPFTRNLWVTILCSIVASAGMMTYFEHETESEDFPLVNESLGRKACRALYYSAMGVSTVDNFHPKTNEGRMYVSVTAFVFFVIMSSYTAQLTAILANKQVPSQEITSIDSFAAIGAPVCVRQNAAQQAFLATFYPQLKVQPVPGLTQAGLLPAIASGICKGGVGPDPELKYSLGGPGIFDSDGFDPTLSFCSLEIVGPLLTFGYYGIPFKKLDTPTVNEATLHAVSVLMDLAIDTGNYTISARSQFFPDPETRPLCQKQAADLAAQIESSQSDVLQLEDMAGLFIMEGAALALAWAIRGRRSSVKHVVKVRESLRSRLRSAVKTGKMSTKRIKEAMAMGGEMRPDWEDAEGGGDDDDSDDFDIDSHAPEDNIGGMEGRLTSLVLEHTAVMAAEVEVLKARLDAKMEADSKFQHQLMEQLKKK